METFSSVGDEHLRMPNTNAGSDGPGRPSKVATLIEKYELHDVGDELEQSWSGTGSGEKSLRELAALFNRRLLAAVASAVGASLLEGEVETLYRLLDGENVSDGDRIQAERRLEREGVDVGLLRSEFVSYQAVRTYLQSHRGVEYSNDVDQVAAERERISGVVGRAEAVTRDKLQSLQRSGHVEVGDLQVTVSARVYCSDCDERYSVVELLDAGGCECAREP